MKVFTRLFVFSFILFPVLISCDFQKGVVDGNHTIISKKYDIGDYTQIVMNVAAEVVYQQISESHPYLQVNIDENIIPHLDIKVVDNCLYIDTKKDSIIRPTKFVIYTTSKELSQAHLAGSGELYLKGEVNSGNFDMQVTGSGTIVTDSLFCEAIDVQVTGSGNARLAGASQKSALTITGSGNIKSYSYFVQDIDCNIMGSGNIEAYPGEKLNATIAGSGNITYKGEPKTVNTKVTGSGKVNKS